MITHDEAASILQTYDLEEILALCNITLEDALCLLVNEGFIQLPEVLPLNG